MNSTRPVLLLATLFLLATAPGLVAQGEEAGEKAPINFGFYGGITEIGFTDLSDFGLGVASRDSVTAWADDGNGTPEIREVTRVPGSFVGLDDADTELTLGFELGFTWAREGDDDPRRNRAVLRAWMYDPGDESFAASSFSPYDVPSNGDNVKVGGITPLLGTSAQVISQGQNLPYRVTGTASVETSAFDLIWTHRLRRLSDSHPGWELEWTAGLRYLSFDTEAQALYTTDTPEVILMGAPGLDAESDELVRFSSETSGIGPIVGARLGYRFGESRNFGIHGALEVSGLRGDTDWSVVSVQSTRDAFVDVPDIVQTDLRGEESDRTLTTIEVDLGLSYRFNENWEVRGGWRYRNFDDIRVQPQLLDSEEPSVPILRTALESATFNGPYVGISFEF